MIPFNSGDNGLTLTLIFLGKNHLSFKQVRVWFPLVVFIRSEKKNNTIWVRLDK